MIIALHRPSPLLPTVPSRFITTLLESANYSVDLYVHYLSGTRLKMNWVHLYHIFTSCISLVYCLSECKSRPDLDALSEGDVDTRIERCKELLGRYSPGWPEAGRYLDMFEILRQPFNPVMGREVVPVEEADGIQMTLLGAQSDGELGVEELLAAGVGQVDYGTASDVMRGFWEDYTFSNG